jgi:hypothetical protein
LINSDMASRLLLRQVRVFICSIVLADLFKRAMPAAAGVFAVGITLFPKTALHAEAPEGSEVRVKL